MKTEVESTDPFTRVSLVEKEIQSDQLLSPTTDQQVVYFQQVLHFASPPSSPAVCVCV